MSTPKEYILSPYQLRQWHQYENLISQQSQRFIFRVHCACGPGHPRPGCIRESGPNAFVAPLFLSTTPDALAAMTLEATNEQCSSLAADHILQWVNRTSPSATSPFLSASFSPVYAFNEAERWNAFWNVGSTQISVIDTWRLPPGQAWLGVELVGAYWEREAFFARWAHEVLIFGRIPRNAIIYTGPVSDFRSLFPAWCANAVQRSIGYPKSPTQAAIDAFRDAALLPENSTPEAKEELLEHVLTRSIALHTGTLLPHSFEDFNILHNEEAVEAVARFAAIFCWWPEWITDHDPSGYNALYASVLGRLQVKLQAMAVKPKVKVEAEHESFNFFSTPVKGAGGPQRRPRVKQEPEYY